MAARVYSCLPVVDRPSLRCWIQDESIRGRVVHGNDLYRPGKVVWGHGSILKSPRMDEDHSFFYCLFPELLVGDPPPPDCRFAAIQVNLHGLPPSPIGWAGAGTRGKRGWFGGFRGPDTVPPPPVSYSQVPKWRGQGSPGGPGVSPSPLWGGGVGEGGYNQHLTPQPGKHRPPKPFLERFFYPTEGRTTKTPPTKTPTHSTIACSYLRPRLPVLLFAGPGQWRFGSRDKPCRLLWPAQRYPRGKRGG